MKKKCTELVFTIKKHSMALAFRSGAPAKVRCASIVQQSGDQPQSAIKAMENLKRAARGLKESTDELLTEFTIFSQAARINGGKLPDVNAIAQQVLSVSINSRSTGGGTDEGNKADPAAQGSLS